MLTSSETDKNSIVHRAGWILVDPWTIIKNGFVYVDSGLIKDVGQGHGPSCTHVVDHGPGVIMPALVNAHTHLELSSLKEKVSYEKGFISWVKDLIKEREKAGTQSLCKGAKDGIREMIESGCGVIGEISSLGITLDMLLNSGLAGVWFKEFLGHNITNTITYNESNGWIVTSLAGHAPHTVSPNLLLEIKNALRGKNLPLSIHLAETEEEIIFLSTGKGSWADFLSERGIDFSNWGLPVKSPVQYLEHLGILDKNTIAVHLIHAGRKDFEILARHNVFVCQCLRSNYNLHKKLPDLEGMLRSGIKVCLGTDSLASVDSLNMFHEMAFASSAFPLVPLEEILAMATINGANALGVADRFGTLNPGKRGQFVYVPINVTNRSSLLEAIISADFFTKPLKLCVKINLQNCR